MVLAIGPLRVAAQVTAPPSTQRVNGPEAVRQYVGGALDTFQKVSVHRESVDWKALRDSVFARTAGARTTDDTWPALQWALRQVDRHSFMQTPRPMPAAERPPVPPPSSVPATTAGVPPKPPGPVPIVGHLLDEQFGYILVPMFVGLNRTTFVDSLQTLIRTFDESKVCGWIVDLRQDHGGNMWPMLAGLGPLLGDTIVGSFFTTTEQGSVWRYRDGHAWAGESEPPSWGGRGTLPPYHARDPLAPVALLIGRGTASSGEATLLAFLGRRNVRSFGDSTAGFNSVNNGFLLPDSATMMITVGYSRARLGRSYALKVAPDDRIAELPGEPLDAPVPLQRAKEWLARQPACEKRNRE